MIIIAAASAANMKIRIYVSSREESSRDSMSATDIRVEGSFIYATDWGRRSGLSLVHFLTAWARASSPVAGAGSRTNLYRPQPRALYSD